ncbi:hypothetical protein E3P92_03167 [Wallemia ichthyophaga]|uniref:Uncharacterized protein n=2 Tax=Wallemia ichthyophaga TaxID=245174 RepID=A0A4T0H6Z7_WALIC|nr:uncharacterized protein J056_003373 [Wallemia ichthyophaga EXF-994]TIA69200.1 hypothetical protein E3P91_03724 [Wallemia ichthyophaga]EOR02811.1 hypothetical protein J056_003373 [Wallemia ichthyophaga EXF-994]TIA79643.1 hypothetical protein E3P98_03169 [Wallemia ichthyophaga]TIA96892.1 hypothetical protein E3P95_03092 [Wallemia ichthyophaga]TIA98229.1 hypothetical protein E3P94_03052 [Wallemia ichthyophaga]
MEDNVPMQDDAVVEAVIIEQPNEDDVRVKDNESKDVNVEEAPETPLNPFDQFTKFAHALQGDHERNVGENVRLGAQVEDNDRRINGLVEDNDFLRQQYQQSSEAAFALSKENQELLSKISLLENQLSVGLAARKTFQDTTVNELSKRLYVLQQERQLELDNEHRSTLSNVKERAGMYTELQSQYEDLRKEYLGHITQQKSDMNTIETLKLQNKELEERLGI